MVAGGNKAADERGALFAATLSQASIVAHELKAPLAAIRQLSLELQDDEITASERLLITQQIELLSERSLRLSSDLALSERLQTSLFPTTSLDPAALCGGVVREIEPMYRAHTRKITMKVSKRAHLMIGNQDLLHRILVNFADNALNYTDEASVVELYAQLRNKESQMRLGVRDYGELLPANVWRAMREGVAPPMQTGQAHSSGLGLIIAHRFAEATGGKIGAIRHRDGATFYIDMPLSQQVKLL